LYSLAAVLSLLSGFLIFFLFIPPETGEAYAVVSVDASSGDRHIGGLLDSAGLEGEYLSESTQQIYIDDFGVLKKIPLDSYREAIEPFDPRDDGFAERIRTFFVRDGERFFFIPLADADRKKLERTVAGALGGIPFNFEILGYYRSFFLCLVLLLPVTLIALFLSGSPPCFAFQVFPLLGFARGGPSALVLAALVVCLWVLFREPLSEFFAVSRYPPFFYARSGLRRLGEKLSPYTLNLVLILVLLLLFGFVALIGELPPLPVWTGLASSCGLSFLVRAAEAERHKKAAHVRFSPVVMLPGRIKTVPLFPIAAVFAPAVFLSILAPLLFPSLSSSLRREASPVSDPAFLISQAEYEEHLAFERSFSRMPLGMSLGSNSRKSEYVHYYLGEDGLIAGTMDEGFEDDKSEEIPSFPLENLMEFLLKYNSRAEAAVPAQRKEWISAVLFLAVLIPAFFLRPRSLLYKKNRYIWGSVR
jgi:hypothetical protein